MSEDKYRTDIITELNKYGHVSRVESHAVSIGIPDLNFYSKAGYETWIEIKWLSPIRDPEIRSSQVMWHRNRWRVGGNSFILMGTWKGDHILIPGSVAESLKTLEKDMEHWTALSYGIWNNRTKIPMMDILNRIEAEYKLERN